jgi:DNA-binding CsgD family transcriptional regulator
MTATLLGRDREIAALDALLADVMAARGGALVLRGEPGIGKTSLLGAATARATAQGMRVLRAGGVESEAHLAFAGLHQLLRPILAAADQLPAPQRDALGVAFGLADAAAPELFLIALAALNLVAEAAARQPLLLAVDDAHWLDRSTGEVLAFMARRLESERVVLLVCLRDGFESPLDRAGLPDLPVPRLDEAAAGALLDARAPDLPITLRKRLLQDAAGNPLALVELPAARERLGGVVPPRWLPLTARLERAFAARVSELPAVARSVLLVAALDDGGVLAEVLAAAGVVAGEPVTMAQLVPSIDARLIQVDDGRIAFRHPLVRSAIHQTASVAERHAAHAALASVLADQPDRRAWHRAASVVGLDEEAAAELEATAARAQQRGGSLVAVAALERAARLSQEPAHRGRRILGAAGLALYFGRLDVVRRVVDEAEPLAVDALERRRQAWARAMALHAPDAPIDPAKVMALAQVAAAVADEDLDFALNLLVLIATRCWWLDPGPEARAAVVTAVERLPGVAHDPRRVAVLGFLAPVEHGDVVLRELANEDRPTHDSAGTDRLLGMTAIALGAFDHPHELLTAAAAALRAQGRLGLLARGLVLQAWGATLLVNWNVAAPAAEEGGRLAAEVGDPLFVAGAQAAQAMLAALRGEEAVAEQLAVEAERIALPIRASAALAFAQLARGVAALGAGRHSEAYEQLRRMFDPVDPAHHPFLRCWAIGDLAEAAAHGDARDDARALLAQLEPLAQRTPSSWFRAAMAYARPLLADDGDAEALFEAALHADLARMPFTRARVQLAYGAWLRRRRRVADSRAYLRAARDVFDALRVAPWAERARRELRASGETSRRRTPEARDLLSPQELQIAQMAAEGLSNREIGQRLYLSHRTVGSHLYRLFPKLGITTRSQLRAALGG